MEAGFMRIGVIVGATEGPDATLDGLIAHSKKLEGMGFATLWMANIFGLEAISSLALVGRETGGIELGTAVVPTYPRHPTVMAQLALTAHAAAEGRFVLGLGLSHKLVIEDMLGYSYEKPARHMREYLEVLLPLLDGENVQHQGDEFKIAAQIQVPGVNAPSVMIAALGPVMLKIAGERTDGTITWMTGPKTLGDHIGPRLRSAAEEAGRAEPRVVAGFPISLTNDAERARTVIGKLLTIYGQLPSYRAMLDREGAEGPADLAIAGDEDELRRGLDSLRDAGVTDFNAAVMPTDDGAAERTLEFLASLS